VKLLLENKKPIADGVVLLTLRHPDGHSLPSWTPGAHVDLVLADHLVRQYSLCGDPHDTSVLRLAVLREEAGRGGSRHVHDVLSAGQLVEVRGPRNHFPLVDAARYLFIAGGIGITPILPMLTEVAEQDWRLVYGGRTRSSMAFLDELEPRGNVEIRPQDEHGLLDLPALLADVGDDTAVYCCGPEPLLAAVEKHHTAGKPHVERFTPKAGATDGPRQEFEVELARTGRVLRVPAGRSILDVVERSGVPVLSSCREGTCGTCETPVLSGTPDHRDSLLTGEERATGDVMMICVSRARSDRLVLDL
jgi:ferredoxin-NADP reductase